MTSRFGAYEILHELKTGGMGAVLLGRRRGPGAFEQLVAIKTIRAELASAASVRAMFLDEAAILARVNHPGIATVHDFGEAAGTLYMVMEYVAGNSLRASLDDGERMPPGVAARVIADAARALHAAHEARDATGTQLGVVHRDISPDNLMLGFDGHIKVIDFGIALIKNRQAPVTELGTVKGKPPYMSPEQVKNEPIDRRSDVFSLGVVLHELLTGAQVFQGDSMYAVALAVSNQAIPTPSQVLGAPLPAGLDAVVMRALERDPSRRTPTAAQLADELERVILVAGDESLAAWSERALAARRETHRTWLANLVTGAGAESLRPAGRTGGRPTGEHTVVAATRPRDPEPIPPPPRRRGLRVVLPLVALLLLAVIGGLAVVVGRDRAAPHAVATLPIDAAVIVGVDALAPRDAVPPRDAEVVRLDATVPLDARRAATPRDAAAVVARAVDAAPAPSGTGTVSFKARRNRYATVVLDGKSIGATPILGRALPAGRHTVEFIDPAGDGSTRLTFELAPDETTTISQPAN